MSRKRTRTPLILNKKFQNTALIVLIVVVLCVALYIAYHEQDNQPAQSASDVGAHLEVAVIDVGQGDSILVYFDSGETMLIDAGTRSQTDAVFSQLDARGIKAIDILIATHPHADHIGTMADVVERYDIGQIYMPDITSDSQTYKRLIAVIEERDIPMIYAYAGLDFSFGPAMCTIVSPQKNAKKHANNQSVVIFLDFGDTDFLFTGDMEAEAEAAVLEAGYAIDAEVLKVAHHGSSSSTTEAFLISVSPDYAVISCGTGNTYGHPHTKTIELLGIYGIETLRTDLLGTVLFVADGERIDVTWEK